ncbi:MAG: hypothetical protein HQK97_10960 [Nitrospirae bacterium]|nr:hypothetical protein [Nitrospirota bacterium]
MKISISGADKISRQRFLWGRLDKMNYDDDTADVVILDQNLTDTEESYKNVPIYYNCEPDMVERSNGALDGAATAFEKNDKVHVRYTLENIKDKTELKIVGFLEDKKPCGYYLLLVYIRNTSNEPDGYEYRLVYDKLASGGDYRTLVYLFDKQLTKIKATGLMKGKLTISDTGLTLNVQSGDGVYAAELPSIFVYNDTIDYAEFMKTSWRSSLTVLYQQRIVGSYYVSNWTKTGSQYTEDRTQFTRMSGSRHAYTNGSDGYINACMFKNRQDLLGTGVMYRELSLFPEDEFYQLWNNDIAYKTKPDDSAYIAGQSIGSDYITGTPWQTGYTWMTFQVIDVFDKDNALVKTESNIIPKGGSAQWPYTLDLVVTSRWYTANLEHALGHGGPEYDFWTTTETWQYNGQTAIFDVLCIRVERLMVGGVEVEKAEYEETRYDSNQLDWIPGATPAMTLVSQSGDAHGGYGDGAAAAVGSVTGHDKFNAELKVESFINPSTGRENVRWQPVSIGEKHSSSKSGYRDIHVMAFDNMDGANNFIIIYKKTYVYYLDSNDTPNVNDGTTPIPVIVRIDKPAVASFHIAYKTKTGGLTKIGISGGDIRAASCQINKGNMAYTYTTWGNNHFLHRIIGVINMSSGKRSEWQTQDDNVELNGFSHFNAAAIGIL